MVLKKKKAKQYKRAYNGISNPQLFIFLSQPGLRRWPL